MIILYYTSRITDHLPGGEGQIAYNLLSHMSKLADDIEFDVIAPFAGIKYDSDFLERVNIIETRPYEPRYSSEFAYIAYKLSKKKKYDFVHQNQKVPSYFTCLPSPPVIARLCLSWTETEEKGWDSLKTKMKGATGFGVWQNPKELFYALPMLRIKIRKKKIDILIADSMRAYKNPPKNVDFKRIYYVPNGVDTKKFRPMGNKAERPTILFCGGIVKPKGLHHLLLALKEIKREIPSVELIVAGDGPMRRNYEEMSRNLNLEKNVKFLGSAEHDNLPPLFSSVNVFCCPSEGEPFGLVNVEAMACGTPVVGFKAGGLPDYIDENVGFLAKPYDYKDLANKLLRVLQDNDLRDRMGKKAREKAVKEFEWEVIARKVIEIYKENLYKHD